LLGVPKEITTNGIKIIFLTVPFEFLRRSFSCRRNDVTGHDNYPMNSALVATEAESNRVAFVILPQEFVHFFPIQNDFDPLGDVMSFFKFPELLLGYLVFFRFRTSESTFTEVRQQGTDFGLDGLGLHLLHCLVFWWSEIWKWSHGGVLGLEGKH